MSKFLNKINTPAPRERERERVTRRLILFLKKESNKPYFFAALFFGTLLLSFLILNFVFSWNIPQANPPSSSSGQTLYSDSNNNIGIGTLYPGAKLEVYSTSSDSVFKLSRQFATSTLFKLGTDSALIINNNNSDVLSIKNGNIGIGTPGPNSKLEVAGIIHSTTGGFKFPDGTIQTTATWDFQYVFPTITLGTVYSVAHGFGAKPSLWQVVVRCKSVNQGWAAGDEITLSTFGDSGIQHQTIAVDSTNIIAIIGAGNLSANNKSTGAGAALDPLAWELIMRAKK